jgi:hypothetical protein
VHVLLGPEAISVSGISLPSPFLKRGPSARGCASGQDILWILSFGMKPVKNHNGYGVTFVCAAYEQRPPGMNWIVPFRIIFHTLGEKGAFPSQATN